MGHSVAELLKFGEDGLAGVLGLAFGTWKVLEESIIIRREAWEPKCGVCPLLRFPLVLEPGMTRQLAAPSTVPAGLRGGDEEAWPSRVSWLLQCRPSQWLGPLSSVAQCEHS